MTPQTDRKYPAIAYSVILAVVLIGFAFVPDITRAKHHRFLLAATATDPGRRIALSHPVTEVRTGVKAPISRSTTDEHYYLINFWATWCPPCVEELPSLEYLSRVLKEVKSNISVVALSVDEQPNQIPKLLSSLDFNPTLDVLHDVPSGLARSADVTKFPETILVNTAGEILYKWVGPQDWLSQDVLGILKRYIVH